MTLSLDIVIPVRDEAENIVRVLDSLAAHVRTPFQVLICFDNDQDPTLPAIHAYHPNGFGIQLIKNTGMGVHAAIRSGFAASRAPAVLTYPADDIVNAPIIDSLFASFQRGHDIVCASRFMPGGRMSGCPWLKSVLVRGAAFSLHRFAGIPTHDATNGFRLFSRRVLSAIDIQSSQGFTYSLELLVKCHQRGWPIAEIPAQWIERPSGKSRFKLASWLLPYLRWYFYAFWSRLAKT